MADKAGEEKMAFAAAQKFKFTGTVSSVEKHGHGCIHDTYLVTCAMGPDRQRYVLQRINNAVLSNPEGHLDNARMVVAHLVQKEEDPRRRITAVDAVDGRGFFEDAKGEYWRAFDFIEDTETCDVVETQAQALEAGRAFGTFIHHLRDLPIEKLVRTLPHFHDTPKRFLVLEKAIAADAQNRAAKVSAEIEFAMAHKEIGNLLVAFQQRGEIEERIVHNDTKVSNILFDKKTGEGICVVDLDTVMPGLALHDFGDLARSACSLSQEDERDLSLVAVRMPIFIALAQGFLESTGESLSRLERDHMAFSAKLIAFELGIRFLTDYLQGDRYFKTDRPGQNVDRCRTQFALVRDVQMKEEEMSRAVERLA